MNQNWEEIHLEKDEKVQKKIRNHSLRASLAVLLGIWCFYMLLTVLGSGLKKTYEGVQESVKAGGVLSSEKVLSFISTYEYIQMAALLILGGFFLIRAVHNREQALKLSEQRYYWCPEEKEIAFINQRFDNDLIRSIVKEVSPTGTKSIEVGLEGIVIRSDHGKSSFYLNDYGYRFFDNYTTRQLAYYLGSKCFPEGFYVFQRRISPSGSDRYIGGMVDYGGEKKPQEDRRRKIVSMLLWLYVQIQDMLELDTGVELDDPEPPGSPIDDGHIVINKGFSQEGDGLKEM